MAEYGQQIKNRGVTDQPHYVASPDQYRRTTFAAFEMLLHPDAQAGTDFVVEVIRDLAPHLVAPDFHCSGHTCLSVPTRSPPDICAQSPGVAI
jgi:hypothetical protein